MLKTADMPTSRGYPFTDSLSWLLHPLFLFSPTYRMSSYNEADTRVKLIDPTLCGRDFTEEMTGR